MTRWIFFAGRHKFLERSVTLVILDVTPALIALEPSAICVQGFFAYQPTNVQQGGL